MFEWDIDIMYMMTITEEIQATLENSVESRVYVTQNK